MYNFRGEMRPKQYLELKNKINSESTKNILKSDCQNWQLRSLPCGSSFFKLRVTKTMSSELNCSNLRFLTLKSDVGTQELKISYKNYYQVCFHVPGSFWE